MLAASTRRRALRRGRGTVTPGTARSAAGVGTGRLIANGRLMDSSIGPLSGERVLADRIYGSIKSAILSLEFPPGAPLVERALAQKFGVSKSPVRDALQRLAGEGLVAQIAHRGMTVQSFDPELVDELYELRLVLEELAVRLAASRFREADVEEARSHLASARAAIDRSDRFAASRANAEFHATFSRRSGNRPLHAALSMLQDRVRVIRLLGWNLGAAIEDEHREHVEILEAVARRDALGAAELMRRHIDAFRRAYREANVQGPHSERRMPGAG